MNGHGDAVIQEINRLRTNPCRLDFVQLDNPESCYENFNRLAGSGSHALTMALYALIPGSKVFVIRDYMDGCVHSAICWPETGFVLDGSGMMTTEDLVRDWSLKSVDDCTGQIESAEAILNLHHVDEQAKLEALSDLDAILKTLDLV